eukprot:gi/632959233/ref/XP_007895501.1/ PREDICTED: lymphoid-restricted membrane protein isoform X2 [Callorhinchus milii]
MSSRRHNPVDSICRKIRNIQMRDKEVNPTLQIPKFQLRNFDSPQTNLKKNMEVVLRNRTVKRQNFNQDVRSAATNCPFSPETLPGSQRRLSTPGERASSAGSTFKVVTSIEETASNSWPYCRTQNCSTPVPDSGEELSYPCSALINIEHRILTRAGNSDVSSPVRSTNLSICTHLHRPQSPEVRQVTVRETNLTDVSHLETPEDMSLITEEDLLDTIFHACDITHQGKVAVSKIVDYLRHTTSRSSEDSGLEDLCNMLDPNNQDISIDLDTYHAVMKEWIEECRRKSIHEETPEVINPIEDAVNIQDGLVPGIKLSDAMNGTAGSLEAFGGEISKGDLESSDLISCIADLQYNNHKLQEQNCKLRLTVDAMEETNHRLMEGTEELQNQIKSAQQSVLKEKSLKEELEEMKANMSHLEDRSEKLLLQNKQMAKDNQSLISQIGSLQEENIGNAIEMDDLHKRIAVLTDDKEKLDMQLNDFKGQIHKKEATLNKKNSQVGELTSTIEEYSLIIEALRTEKNNLENQMLLMQQELATGCTHSRMVFKDSPEMTGLTDSLQSELLFAQHFPELDTSEWFSSSVFLDTALDKEVQLLLQPPGPQQTTADFKRIITRMTKELSEEMTALSSWLRQIAESERSCKDLNEAKVELLKSLQEKSNLWLQNLQVLVQLKLTVDQEYVTLASNFRRSRTEELHWKKKQATRLRELETQKRLAEERLVEIQESPQCGEKMHKQMIDKEACLSAWKESEVVQQELKEAVTEKRNLRAINNALSDSTKTLKLTLNRQQKTIQSLKKLYKEESCALQRQRGICSKRLWSEGASQDVGRNCAYLFPSTHQGTICKLGALSCYTPLLDALTLELPNFYPCFCNGSCCAVNTLESYPKSDNVEWQNPEMSANEQFNKSGCEQYSVGVQTDIELSVSGTSETSLKQASAGQTMDSRYSPPSENLTAIQEISLHDSLETNRMLEDGSSLLVRAGQTLSEKVVRKNGAEEELSSKESPGTAGRRITFVEDNTQLSDKTKDLLKRTLWQKASATEQEVETEFLRFSLAFKCDKFTLEKRLRLDQRSKELAETNLKKEVENCQQMIKALYLLDQEEQSQEILEKLDKSLAVLGQAVTRVASRAEMLGAIHQEARVSKAVEVMIQHVENLKRMYTKEHTELEEMKLLIVQNQKITALYGENRDDLRNKKSSISGKGSMRRVSMPAIPKNTVGHLELKKLKDSEEFRRLSDGDKYNFCGNLKSNAGSWKHLGSKKNPAAPTLRPSRPSLQRFISYTWGNSEDLPENKGTCQGLEVDEEESKDQVDSPNSAEPGNKCPSAESRTFYDGISTHLIELGNTFLKNNQRLCFPLILVLALTFLASLVIGWTFRASADAATVGTNDGGTGDSWTSVQQFLWPYTGLQHNAQPPV